MFPSVTPVCLSSIATGAWPDEHGIPHLVWYDREEGRIVEYGSSLGRAVAAGVRGTVRDSVLNMSGSHLSADVTTVFEALEDAGLVTGAITFLCFRGRHRHVHPAPRARCAVTDGSNRSTARNGSSSSTSTSRTRPARRLRSARGSTARSIATPQRSAGGSSRATASTSSSSTFRTSTSRPTRPGPDGAQEALERADAALLAQLDGGRGRLRGVPEPLRDRRLLRSRADPRCRRSSASPAGSTTSSHWRRGDPGPSGARSPCAPPTGRRCSTCCPTRVWASGSWPSGSTESRPPTSFCSARPGGRSPGVTAKSFASRRSPTEVSGPRVTRRCSTRSATRTGSSAPGACLAGGRSGDVVVSAADGYEFADLGGRHHRGGGSHGSLLAGDSRVPDARRWPPGPAPPGRERRGSSTSRGLALAHLGVRAWRPCGDAGVA